VYTDPSVSIGDVIDIVGYVGDYYGEAQLQDAEITVTGSGSVSPLSLSASEASAEAYEAVLVTIIGGSVTNLNYDCSVDGSACEDEGLWEIDGSSGVLVFDRLYQGTDWTAQKGNLPVTGVMNYRWNRRRVMPRTTADFGE
jgi:hypothetical protein